MIEKFKSLSKAKKIIVGIIAFMLLPITLLALSVDLIIKGVKTKKVGKIVIGVLCTLIMFSVLTTSTDTSNSTTSSNDNSIDTPSEEVEEDIEIEEPKKFELGQGMYKVGNDLPAGEYLLIADRSFAYYQVSTDSTGEISSIVSNDNFSANRYVTVKEGQYLELKGCTLVNPNETVLDMTNPSALIDGMYKVGVDIEPGEYKVRATGSMGYVEVCTTSEGGIGSIVSNDNFEGEKYITVSEGQYLKLSNKAELIK